MIHPERRRENLKKIEEMDKRDAEPLQPNWKTWCMNKKVDMVEVVRCKDCKHKENERLCPIAHVEKTEYMRFLFTDNWFCANGKRRNDELQKSY